MRSPGASSASLGGEANGRLGAQPEIACRVGQLAQLLRGRLDDAVLSVAGVDAPQARKPVEQGVPRRVGHRRAHGRLQHTHAHRLMAAIGRDRVNQMRAIEFDQRIRKHFFLQINRVPD